MSRPVDSETPAPIDAEERPAIVRIVAETLRLDPPLRLAYIRTVVGTDRTLEAEAVSLVNAAEDAGSFLSRSAGPAGRTDGLERMRSALSRLESPGARIGPYTLLRRIGEGAFGSVFEAEQNEPVRRRVALKIIKLGMDTRQVVARFEQERQALAMMEHPSIARVFDAGATETGRPYFAMEFVEGAPITTHCDAERLEVRDRLDLFVAVCLAVQHAHQKGIVHRDLKPANILVVPFEGAPFPKIIDFGIAKAMSGPLTDKTILTECLAVLGTPAYMAPEQASELETDIDTRADVYALGVLLYELLTGAPPLADTQARRTGYETMLRAIREFEPPRPSARVRSLGDGPDSRRRARELRGDLDWIVMRAIEKDRSRRYPTASELAADVTRYLRGEPVQAAPPGSVYLTRKFVRRHRGPVIGGLLVVGALVAGVIGTSIATVSARRHARESTVQSTLAQQARTAAEFEAYIANLYAADSAISAGDSFRVRTALDACPQHLRGWEWNWLNARSDTSLLALRGHSDRVHCAAFGEYRAVTSTGNPPRLLIATGSKDLTARVWDASTGTLIAEMRGHRSDIPSVALNAEGTLLVTASRDRTARVWDVFTGETVAIMSGHEMDLTAAAFSPDGSRVLTASVDSTARLWDARSGEAVAVLRGHTEEIRDARFSPDGSTILTASYDGTARLWDARTGSPMRVYRGHKDRLTAAAFSRDGARIVSTGYDNSARVWETASGECLATLRGHGRCVIRASFNSTGTRVVTASDDGTARVWEVAGGTEVFVLRGHTSSIREAMFRSDDACVLTAGHDRTIRMWSSSSGDPLAVMLGHDSQVETMAPSPDGECVVTASVDGTARVWSVYAEFRDRVLRGHTSEVRGADFDPIRPRVVTASGDGTARIWDLADRSDTPITVLRDNPGRVISARYSPDGARIVTACELTARVWDAESGSPLVLLWGHTQRVTNAAFSPDSKFIATSSLDSAVRVWDAGTGALTACLLGHSGRVYAAAFSPDGATLASCGEDGTTRLWDLRTGAEIASHRGPRNGSYFGFVAFSPDGRSLITGSADFSVMIWDIESRSTTVTLRGHERDVYDSSFSPCGTRVVTASSDGTARVWNTRSGRELAVLRDHAKPIYTARFSPDGSRILTASADRTARIWDSLPFRSRYESPRPPWGPSAPGPASLRSEEGLTRSLNQRQIEEGVEALPPPVAD